MATNNSINTPLITLGGPLTTSGAFSSTFTMTGTTSVTFPTSGTLATVGAGGGITKIIRQTFTSNGTYTPTSGMVYCEIEAIGGGGGGGGIANSTATTSISYGGGGAGSYSRKISTAATIGGSQTVTIGAAGTAGANTGATGGNGGDTSVGAICIGKGGSGGTGGTAATYLAGAGGVAGTGDVTTIGNAGENGRLVLSSSSNLATSLGGASVFGGRPVAIMNQGNGPAGTTYGCGGSAGISSAAAGAQTGGAGFAGIVIITEYVSA